MTAEGDIKRACLAALEVAGAWAIRVQSGKVRVRGGWMHLAPIGTADILVLVPPLGRALWLEVKTDEGTERDGQLAFADGARRLGAGVRTVRGPVEAVRAYAEALARPEASWGDDGP